jgi:replicative DNA helicase
LAYYVERLKTCLAKRRIYEAGLKTAVDALSIAPEAPDPAALVGSAVESFASIQSGTEREAVTLRQAFLEMADVIGQPKQLGLATPFRRLNDVTPGFKPGKYWLISGGPSDGKSAMAQNLSSCMLNADIPHTYYSAELTVEELTQRYLAINCNVSLNLWEKLDTEITHEDHIALANSSRWNGLDLLNIVDAVGWTVDQVCIHMAEMAAQGHKAAVIDYLALLELEYLAPKMREQQVARASQKLQRAAKKTGMTVFVLSQLNDDGQVRESRAPHQDCDVHIRMEKVTEKGPDGEPREATDKRKMRIMKSRQGKRGGLFYFQFVGEFQRFYEIQYTEEPLPEKGRTWKTRK